MPHHPDWICEIFSMNMAYRPRSLPNFRGDLQHDLRDAMHDARPDTLAQWAGWAADHYLAAARLLDVRDDPVADSLEVFRHFDLRSLQVAHDHMAAHWRFRFLPDLLKAPVPGQPSPDTGGHFRASIAGCLYAFRLWLKRMVDFDAKRDPVVIRRLCLVLVQQNTLQGHLAEIDLHEALRTRYPLA